MPSCYACSSKYSFFRKEVGCGNCGFSFCSKCCSQKIGVPKKNNKVLNVCANCFKRLTNENDEHQSSLSERRKTAEEKEIKTQMSPPANFLKLVEQNNSKFQPKPQQQKQQLNHHLSNVAPSVSSGHNSNLNFTDPVDQALAARLANLNEQTKQRRGSAATPLPTNDEIEERLKKLKEGPGGVAPLSAGMSFSSGLPKEDKVQTSEDIISQIMAEVDLEEKFGTVPGQEEEDEDKNKNENDKKTNEDDSDEEKWCYLCNADATLLCFDCDDDLYCQRCFKQSHFKHPPSSEYKRHRTKIF